MQASTHVRGWLVAACLLSALAVACGDDDDSAPHGTAGMTGDAGNGESGSGNPGGSGSSSGGKSTGGRGGTSSDVGGSPPDMPEAGAGGTAEMPDGFTAFVHDLVENQTHDDNAPVELKDFADTTDDHGHYLVPESDFDDLF